MNILEEMRESADYKLGYAMSSIRVAVDYLERGDVAGALRDLRTTLKRIRTTAEVHHDVQCGM